MNKLCSEANSMAIRNVYQCTIAAELLGFHDMGMISTQIEYDTSRPTGCYYWKGNNGTGVRYNRFLDTKRNADASLLCQNGKNEFCKKSAPLIIFSFQLLNACLSKLKFFRLLQLWRIQ